MGKQPGLGSRKDARWCLSCRIYSDCIHWLRLMDSKTLATLNVKILHLRRLNHPPREIAVPQDCNHPPRDNPAPAQGHPPREIAAPHQGLLTHPPPHPETTHSSSTSSRTTHSYSTSSSTHSSSMEIGTPLLSHREIVHQGLPHCEIVHQGCEIAPVQPSQELPQRNCTSRTCSILS